MEIIAKHMDYEGYIHEPNNRKLDHLPGDYGMPLLGHSIQFLRDPFEWAQHYASKYGLLSRISTAGNRGIMALGPDLVEQVLLDSGRNFSSKMGFMTRVSTFFAGSLIMEDFEHHRHQRRIAQTAFKNEAMQHYTRDINVIYQRALDEWSSDVGKNIPFFLYVKELLLQIAAEIFIGEIESRDRTKRINQSFVDCANGTIYLLPIKLPGFALYKGLKGRDFLQQFFRNLVAEKRAGEGLDILSHFCREKNEEGNYFSNDEIANQMIFLMFAAHDTTTAAITHTVYYLARHPDVKERLYQECKSLGKDSLEYGDLEKLPYMQRVFNEVLRLRPSAPLIPRRTIRDVIMQGYRVPAHTLVLIMPRFSHYMEEYWTEPNKFDPDRFSPERAEHKKHRFLYHPFGGGAHKCIGMHFAQMEYKCFFYKFILQYDFVAKHKSEPYMQTLPLPRPADNMPIELIKR